MADNGYTVARITPDQGRLDARARDGTITVVGVMPELNTGEAAEFGGQWVNDPRWGLQFKAEMVKPILDKYPRPVTDEAKHLYDELAEARKGETEKLEKMLADMKQEREKKKGDK